MKNHKNKSNRSGFTLIEILTVITILAVLGGIGFGTFMLVNRQAKSKQAEVMIENLSTNLEARVAKGFSQDDLDDLGAKLQLGTLYPSGDGSDTSTANLYAVLSGDFDSDGDVDTDVGGKSGNNRQPMFPQIDPEYTGKGKYVNDDRILVDAWLQPLRYRFPGNKNNVENGFDLWSVGPDGMDTGTNDEGDNATLDNINNW